VFDRKELISKLGSVNPPLRCLFAACCATRLQASLSAFAVATTIVNHEEIDQALSSVWKVVEATGIDEIQLKRLVKRCGDDSGRVEERGRGPLALAASDAIASVGYALMSLQSHKPEDAAWAGSRAIDSFFQYITTYLQGPTRTIDKKALREAFAHPLYTAELKRQARDVTALAGANARSAIQVASHLRIINERDGAEILRLLSSPTR
jgi:hypothetical protein